jgi:hypothetical protein
LRLRNTLRHRREAFGRFTLRRHLPLPARPRFGLGSQLGLDLRPALGGPAEKFLNFVVHG